MSADRSPRRVGILFVCHANVCRSPLAEGVLAARLASRGLRDRVDLDSAGVCALSGAPPHSLSVEVARRRGMTVAGVSRQLVRADFSRFDEVVAMDRDNLAEIERLRALSAFGPVEGERARVRLFRSLAESGARGRDLDVPDPVSGGIDGYERVLALLIRGCDVLVEEIATAITAES